MATARNLSSDQVLHTLRIVQEAFTNALKHSRPRCLSVHFENLPGGAWALAVGDDGEGFDPQALQGRGDGLRNMRSRCRSDPGGAANRQRCGRDGGADGVVDERESAPVLLTAMFSTLIDPPPAAQADARERFVVLLRTALADGSFVRLLLSRHVGAPDTLERLTVREVQLRGERQLSFLWRHQTKDVTKNHPLDEGLAQVAALLGRDFLNAHLHTRSQEIQLVFSRKGKPSLRIGALAAEDQPAENAAHDKAKQRPLSLDAPFWTDLGLTHEVKGERQLVPAMSRKWKQINKFIEVFAHALRRSRRWPMPRALRVSTSAPARAT
jgi:hypothetical protein